MVEKGLQNKVQISCNILPNQGIVLPLWSYWSWHVTYAVQLVLEWPDTIGQNQMSQIVDMFLEEIALDRFIFKSAVSNHLKISSI